MALAHEAVACSSPIVFEEWLGSGGYGKSMQKWWEGGLSMECVVEKAVDVLFAFCSSERNLVTL